jgi:hypothetical protein
MQIHRHPEKPTISRINDFGTGLRTLENPLRRARLGIDFVPPAQTDQAAPSYVFQVVEVGGEEEDCYYED